MTNGKNHKRQLLDLYLINAGANVIGSLIVGTLNLYTPTEFFKFRRSFIADEGWILILLIYPTVITIGASLQYFAQKPLKRYFDSENSKGVNQSILFQRARHRLLLLPPIISLLNIAMWVGLSLVGTLGLVIIKFMPSLNTQPIYSYSWHTVYFAYFRGAAVGCIAAGLSLLIIEAYSRKYIIPTFFPDGRLAEFKKIWKISILRRIRFLYYSGTVVPMIIFVGTLFYVEAEARGATVPLAVFGKDLLFYTVSLYIMFVLLSLWLNFLVSRSILEPIGEMIGTIRKVGAGDFNHRAKVVSNDELGVLGDAVNEMTASLVEGEVLRHSYNLAREAQLALLPESPPVLEGLDIAARSVYCEETGGDYFDFLQPPESDGSQISVIMGDACGLGISSALLMATGRAHVRQRSAIPGTLADIVSDVNRQLVLDGEESCQFMALFYIMLDRRQRTLTWVRAGHNPAVFYDPLAGKATQLRGDGLVLGVDENWNYKQYHKEKLTDGQVIVLATDGLWETLNRKGDMFGRDPIFRILHQYADADANGILTACLFARDKFREGMPQDDDASIIVIKIK